MNFLSPLFLWLAPLAAAPLLIHLIHRRPPKPLPFSHVAWLKSVHKSTMPRKNLRDRLLLILRTLVMALLVAGFARPIVQPGGAWTRGSEGSSVLFLIDTSASMGVRVSGQEGLSLAIARIEDLLRKIPPEVKVGFIAYSDRSEAEFAPNRDRTSLLSQLRNLTVQPRPTDLQPALALAYKMLANQSAGKKSLVLVSDQARNGYQRLLERTQPVEGYDPSVRVVAWEVVPVVANTGIKEAGVVLSGEGTLKGEWVPSRSGGAREPTLWTFRVNDKVLAQGTVEGAPASIPFQAPFPEGGAYAGRLELSPDLLPFDDTFFVAGRVPRGFRLLLVDGESGLAPADSEVYYLRTALESPRDPRVQTLSVLRPEGLTAAALAQTDVLVLANVESLSPEISQAVVDWVEQGGGLWLTAGSKWLHRNRDPLGLIHLGSALDRATEFEKPNPAVPPISDVAGVGDFEWSEISVDHRMAVEEDSSAVPLLRVAGGDPIFLRKAVGRGTVFVWLTSIDRAWTNFPAKPIFPPLVREVVASLADPNRGTSSLMFEVDQPAEIRLSPSIKSVTVELPTGRSLAGRVDEAGVLRWTETHEPGLYRLKTGSPLTDLSFAVNIRGRAGEGDTTRLSGREFKKVFPDNPSTWVSFGDRSAVSVASALQGWPATPMLFGFILLLLFVETALANGVSSLKKIFAPAAAALLLLAMTPWARAGTGDHFVLTQLRYDGLWDPYPQVSASVIDMIQQMTNISPVTERRVVQISDDAFFESPFIWIKGSSALHFTEEEKKRLKRYLDGGGLLFFDDTLAHPKSPFADSVRLLLKEIYPDRPFQRMPAEHALYRSFFLLRNVSGRRVAQTYFEGIDIGGQGGGEGRTAVILSVNDLMGAWARDPSGAYIHPCDPGGEPQRWESFKLTLNLIYFSLTGTYKKDAIHQPFIEKKLGS